MVLQLKKDLECEFQVKTNEDFYSHIQELRLKFSGVIRDHQFMQYTQNTHSLIFLKCSEVIKIHSL